MIEDPKARLAALLRAQAGVDGELDAANALKLEEDVNSNAILQRAWESGRALRSTVAEHVEKQQAPAGLRNRVLALAIEAPNPARSPRRSPRYAALAASLTAVGFLTGYLVATQRSTLTEASVPPALIAAYERAQLSGQAFDVASSDRHTVKPWLAARTPLGAEVIDLSDAGFELAGGRLDLVDRSPVATVVYRRREHWIDLSEVPRRDVAAPAAPSSESVDGYRVRRWSDAARSYIAVSDIDDVELTNFVEAFRHKAESKTSGSPKP